MTKKMGRPKKFSENLSVQVKVLFTPQQKEALDHYLSSTDTELRGVILKATGIVTVKNELKEGKNP
jgi:hypothetical protein